MRWLTANAGWILAALGVLSGGVGIYTRSALADVNTRIAVLEANRHNDVKSDDEIRDRLRRIEEKQDRILERLP